MGSSGCEPGNEGCCEGRAPSCPNESTTSAIQKTWRLGDIFASGTFQDHEWSFSGEWCTGINVLSPCPAQPTEKCRMQLEEGLLPRPCSIFWLVLGDKVDTERFPEFITTRVQDQLTTHQLVSTFPESIHPADLLTSSYPLCSWEHPRGKKHRIGLFI